MSNQMTIAGRRCAVGLTWSVTGYSAVIWTIRDGVTSHALCDSSAFHSAQQAKEAAVHAGLQMLYDAGENEHSLAIN